LGSLKNPLKIWIFGGKGKEELAFKEIPLFLGDPIFGENFPQGLWVWKGKVWILGPLG